MQISQPKHGTTFVRSEEVEVSGRANLCVQHSFRSPFMPEAENTTMQIQLHKFPAFKKILIFNGHILLVHMYGV